MLVYRFVRVPGVPTQGEASLQTQSCQKQEFAFQLWKYWRPALVYCKVVSELWGGGAGGNSFNLKPTFYCLGEYLWKSHFTILRI